MKVRDGFISNSSAASFLVKCKEPFLPDKDIKPLSPEDELLLQDMGFFKTLAFYPDQVNENNAPSPDYEFYNYGLYISCNESEILQWLVENNISFSADCHYGQYTIVFNNKWKYVLSLKNMGILYLMKCLDTMDGKAYKKIPKDRFIETGGYFF